MQLLVGLGNPGDRYKFTRHNLGFLLLDELVTSSRQSFKSEKKFNAEIAYLTKSNERIACLKPQTYMNNSGQAVAPYLNFYQFDPAKCLVVHDELDLPFGEVRLKFGGGEGGHNGLKSISQCLGTNQYLRMRMGIGKPEAGNLIPMEDWVLSKFRESEMELYKSMMEQAQAAITMILEVGFSKAQNFVNANSK